MSNTFKVLQGGMADRFMNSRAKIQVIGGGFANGKTAMACIKALRLAQEYPGSNGLMARSTYPKLNDTLRKEFLKWCPKKWIKSFPMSNNGSNTCTLTNGTTINFRYVQQQSRGEEGATSNLLSATYDWIIVDQMEDPEIVYKDFLDLQGRLRGSTPYIGDDPTMPRTGPRIMVLTCNPTRNWFYKKIVQPIHLFKQTGSISPDLICLRDEKHRPILVDDKPQVLVDLIEGSTYENAHVLEKDFIQTLEATYQGQMRERFLMGEWAAYDGLVYPQFNEVIHTVEHRDIMALWDHLHDSGYNVPLLDAYDFGISNPSCYLAAFMDNDGNVIIFDGFYKKELGVTQQAEKIRIIRNRWGMDQDERVFADPQIFKRSGGNLNGGVGQTIAQLFDECGVPMRRGNNDILGGIVKVGAYLNLSRFHRNPFTGEYGAPHIYFSRELNFVIDEFGGYYWDKDNKGDSDDKPKDKDDHAMDTMKYLLTSVPDVAKLDLKKVGPPSYLRWHEGETNDVRRRWRHGGGRR